MSQMERIYAIHKMLERSRAVSFQQFLEKLEVSRPTIKRDLQYMRDRLGAPIEYDRERKGYCYRQTAQAGGADPEEITRYQLPGVWLNSAEMHALLLMHDLLRQLDTGILGGVLAPAARRIESLLSGGKITAKDIRRRFRMIAARHRPVDDQIFRLVSTAVLHRKRLNLTYFSRSRGEILKRTVSPQRLIWYSSNWYLDAWCHWREDFRSFALDAIRGATMLSQKANDYPHQVLDARLGAGYGIFAGQPKETAVLRFRLPASRWVEREIWHPDQRLIPLSGNEFRLEVPYSDPRELVQDILRFVPHVTVEDPESLRELVVEHLKSALAVFREEERKPAASEALFSAG